MIWIRIILAVIAYIGVRSSTGLCLLSLTLLITAEISFSRMNRANARIAEHNANLPAAAPAEPQCGFWEAIRETCGLNYYWLVPGVIICLLLINQH